MRKFTTVLLALFTILTMSVSVYAASFYLPVYEGGNPSFTAPVQKTGTTRYAYVRVANAEFFDQLTDTVYIRVRNLDGTYATQYGQLSGSGVGSFYLNYLPGQGVKGLSYRLYANMYSSVTGGVVNLSGTWNP